MSLKNRPFGVLSIDSVSIDSVSIKIDRSGGTGLTSEEFRTRVLKKFRTEVANFGQIIQMDHIENILS